MPFLDRTKEFKSILENKRKTTIIQKTNNLNEETEEEKSIFHVEAKKIASELQQTTDLLQKLIKIIKKKTPFDDNSKIIQQYSELVKENLVHHNQNLLQLEGSVEEMKNKQSQQFSGSVINSLKDQFAYAKETFETALKTRTKNIKKQQERTKHFVSQEKFSKSPKNQDSRISSKLNVEPVVNDSLMLQQHQQQPVDDFSQRTEAIRDIESTLHEISGMYVKLGELVSIQGELTSKIESNIEEASTHVDEGSNQIMEWYSKVTSSRGLMLKLFLVLVVFIIIVAVFML
eukprot:gene6487-10495_t